MRFAILRREQPLRRRRRLVLLTLAALTLAIAFAASMEARHVMASGEFETPPAGGITIGTAGDADPASVAAAQPFSVHAVWFLDPASQQWQPYLPGAPAGINTLDAESLHANSIVVLRRSGDAAAPGTPPQPPTGVSPSGDANVLDAPPVDGISHGISGTNDPERLAGAQGFAVLSIAVLDVPSQQWLTYVVGAPAWANSLATGLLQPDSIVTIRRGADSTSAAPVAPAAPAAPPEPAETEEPTGSASEREMLALVNAERESRGLPPLQLDPALSDVARAHSVDMRERDFFSHVNPDGTDPFDRMNNAGIDYQHGAENIARYSSVDWAHAELMASEGHRRNLLNENYERIGIGIVQSPAGFFITQVFAG